MLDELKEEFDNNGGKGFWGNRAILADAFRRGTLYGVAVTETEQMLRRGARGDASTSNTPYIIPCLCVRQGPVAVIMWVHERVRRMGIGAFLVGALRIRKACEPLPDSAPFWEACGVRQLDSETRRKRRTCLARQHK